MTLSVQDEKRMNPPKIFDRGVLSDRSFVAFFTLYMLSEICLDFGLAEL